MLDSSVAGNAAQENPAGSRITAFFLRAYQAFAILVLLAAPVLAIPDYPERLPADLPVQDLFAFFLFAVPYGLALLYLLTAFQVQGGRRDLPAVIFVLFSTSAAVALAVLAGTFILLLPNALLFIWPFSLAAAAGGLVALALVFPQPPALLLRFPVLCWTPFLAGLGLAAAALPELLQVSSARSLPVEQALIAAAGIGLVLMAALGIVRRFRSISPRLGAQSVQLAAGAIFAMIPVAAGLIGLLEAQAPGLHPFWLLPAAVLPLSAASALLRRRRSTLDLVRNGSVYALMAVLVAVSYLLLVWGAGLLFSQWVSPANPLLIGLMVFILAAVFQPARERLQRAVDTVFDRNTAGFRDQLSAFNQQLTQVMGLREILGLIERFASANLQPAAMHIFLFDPMVDQFTAVSTGGDAPSTDLRFTRDSALAAHLAQEQAPVLLTEDTVLPAALRGERARLALLGGQLFAPLIGRRALIGWLALSGRQSGLPYGSRELAFLDGIADQAAAAVERARVVDDLQRRVHEMNVLGRVAQGINVTLNFDDTLELIYAQTIQVVPADQFQITLFDEITGAFRYVFYLEGDERAAEKENRALMEGFGLEQEVIRSRRPVNTTDYDSESRRRRIVPTLRGVYAWLGVPLNAGSETIGALSLGSRDPSVVYSTEQQNIVQSIADQAAGAIVKTDLLEESERRTQQLESLNQAARSLTQELELEPLLNRILENAVEIFRCEAGSLFLVEEDTGEIVFTVVIGGAEDLVGTRLPRGTGLVGKSIDTRAPILQNNVRQNEDWYEATDAMTGFTTESLLVVPMQVRDEVIGVIEVINKQDGSPFTQDDERLLMAFSAQAAIAVQNARLFTMTDQALAARVDELSVMQRIDRELNASLDLERVFHITLVWALRQSGAVAGVIAAVEGGDVAIMDAAGYAFEIGPAIRERFVGLPGVRAALAQARAGGVQPESGSQGLLEEPGASVAVPILRSRQPIGLLFLETGAGVGFSPETIGFLNRLSDHAAIAIANAQFYAEVQEANIAKSDFISFVSHELKTPMTSIKGYADLLSAGAVGEVSDAQAGFLSTIRANVDRMATLVSDLTDVSRIETGRLRLDYGAVPVRMLVDEVLHSVRGQIEEKGQEVVVRVAEGLPPVWADRTRLTQVMTNLVSNAVKYTADQGTITIEAGLAGAAVSGIEAAEVVQVSIVDTGIGIKREDQAQIFTKFFRSEDLKAREVPGTGLGLNITKNLVEMQGGKIWFESEYRRGSRFTFTVPVAVSE